MWTYVQLSGDLFKGNAYIETGYSGKVPEGKNDPSKECVKNVGPIPRGLYDIGPEKSSPSPVTLVLSADDPRYCNPPRDGFLIHGDNSTGTASTGCIILSRKTRERIRDSGDDRLKVVRDSVRVSRIKRRRYAVSLGL
jgi:hypothetical protein